MEIPANIQFEYPGDPLVEFRSVSSSARMRSRKAYSIAAPPPDARSVRALEADIPLPKSARNIAPRNSRKILDSSRGVKGNFGWTVHLGEVELAFWPAAVVLQALDAGSAAQMASAVVAAALTNAVLYGVLGLLTHLAWRAIRHRSSER